MGLFEICDGDVASRCVSIFDNLLATAIWVTAVAAIGALGSFFLFFRQRRVFVSIPMSALSDPEKFKEYKSFAENLCRDLMTGPRSKGIKCYCAYAGITGPETFGTDDAETTEVYRQIRKCKYFLAIFPSRSYSSVLVETGYALAKGKRCILWSTRTDAGQSTLPYVLEKANANTPLGHQLRKHEFRTFDDIIAAVRNNPSRFLNPNAK